MLRQQPRYPQLREGVPVFRFLLDRATPVCAIAEPITAKVFIRSSVIAVPELHTTTWADVLICRFVI